ncbi:MAG: hypothetical protein ACRC7C_19840 [Beijerinckiaceae bacterium]
MTTNPPRYKAGGLPPTQLHRAMPTDFVSSDDDEQLAAERERLLAYHRGMRNAIPRQEADVETVEQYDTDAAEIAWVGWLLVACALVVIFGGIGYLVGRFFS